MHCNRVFTAICFSVAMVGLAVAAEPAADERRAAAQEFHIRAQERTGLLIPLYVYPANIHTNATYNQLIDLKRRYVGVPMWVVFNPASGPGNAADGNYSKAIDRLEGSGCMVLGYVSTRYGKRAAKEVQTDIDTWRKLYPRTQGIFFDEMAYDDTDAAMDAQVALNRHAREAGFWPTVGNPGAETPERYFRAPAADVIVIHEGRGWPEESRLKGDYFGGYADYPPFTRALLVYSQKQFDAGRLEMARKYVRWIYITDGATAGSGKESNPWGALSKHLEQTCEQLAK